MKIYTLFFVIFSTVALGVNAQTVQRDFSVAESASLEIVNLYGRVEVSADETGAAESVESEQSKKVFLTAANANEADVKIVADANRVSIVVSPSNRKSRVDLSLKIPARMRVRIQTGAGEVRVSGDFSVAEVKTETGTISTDVPTENLKYDFLWTESRPRFLSDVELKKVKEKAGGKFVVSGVISGEEKKKKKKAEKETAENSDETEIDIDENSPDDKNRTTKDKGQIALNFTTARGIILLNVPLNEVSPDLRERPLTDAAKAVIRSGDGILTEAIRRASPKYFGEYAKTLPPRRQEPDLKKRANAPDDSLPEATLKRVLARVTDLNNRTISGLGAKDFDVVENGERREVLLVESSTAPFNLVLLLDVSGSIDSYVDFLRKAARQFVETAGRDDRIAIVIFNEDAKTLSTFTTDKNKLSESLDTFDAGGGTAFYDAIAFALTDTLRPLKGERTAIVALTDGDDNRSFLPFSSLLGSIQESGALVYPLYVPSALIAASAANPNQAIDPMRNRYMSLTTKASGEGEKLAEISGGVYYPISRLSQIQTAYEDIILQLRTAYTVTFRSNFREQTGAGNRASPRLKIKIKRDGTFVKLGAVVEVPGASSNNIFPPNSSYSFARYRTTPENLFQNPNEISGEIERVDYKQFVNDNLRESKFETLDINNSTGAFLLSNGAEKIAASRWISPKRTRSYPYERVYDTLAFAGKRATIIPVLKDEGAGGERDFLAWDTISLMSLLDVFVVPAFYNAAIKNEKRADQITAQKLDNEYVTAKLKEVFAFRGTARQWNEAQSKRLKEVFERARAAYREISKTTKTYLHDETALDELINLAENPDAFAEFSRRKSKRGQSRELQSIQPKEALSTDTKGGVTITNLAGGKYFFTCDETRVENGTLFLIEDKHSQRAILPSENDIKDGLLKIMIYTNLKNVRVGKTPVKEKSVLRLTSFKLAGSIDSNAGETDAAKFFQMNLLNVPQTNLIKKLFDEARANDFTIIFEHAETAKQK